MKTLAEQLREFMDRVAEAPVNVKYDFTWTIDNPFQLPPDATPEQIDNWEEEIDVGVNYTMSGSYRSGRVGHPDNWTPDEQPELDSLSVFNLKTGEDITDAVSKESMAILDQKAWDDYADQDNEPDYDDRPYDDR